MSLILNIDTALDIASVCLAKEKETLQLSVNKDQKDHASWLHTCIADMLQKTGYAMKDINAVAVSIGPGSYTGLRVGLAAAKGFCYALQIPLITVNTLRLIAFAAKDEAIDLICPMIDARRMEVFTTLYDINFEEIIPQQSLVLNETNIERFCLKTHIVFCGNANHKVQSLLPNKNVSYSNSVSNASHLAQLSHPIFIKKEFADLAYCEPFYLKEFYSTASKS